MLGSLTSDKEKQWLSCGMQLLYVYASCYCEKPKPNTVTIAIYKNATCCTTHVSHDVIWKISEQILTPTCESLSNFLYCHHKAQTCLSITVSKLMALLVKSLPNIVKVIIKAKQRPDVNLYIHTYLLFIYLHIYITRRFLVL